VFMSCSCVLCASVAVVNLGAAPSEGGEGNVDLEIDESEPAVLCTEEDSRLGCLEERAEALEEESERVAGWFRDQIRGVGNYFGRLKREKGGTSIDFPCHIVSSQRDKGAGSCSLDFPFHIVPS